MNAVRHDRQDAFHVELVRKQIAFPAHHLQRVVAIEDRGVAATGLDPVARQEVLGELMSVLVDEDCTILFSSHNTLDVEQISDQITFIDRGRIIDTDDKETFLDRWRRLRLLLPPDTALPKLPGIVDVGGSVRLPVLTTNRFEPAMVSTCQDMGVTVQSVDNMTLEEIFVTNVQSRRERATA